MTSALMSFGDDRRANELDPEEKKKRIMKKALLGALAELKNALRSWNISISQTELEGCVGDYLNEV